MHLLRCLRKPWVRRGTIARHMSLTRRDWLKRTASAGGALLLPNATGWPAAQGRAGGSAVQLSGPVPPRERLLADFGWRFHLGHASDPARDFGFGQGRVFDKVGRLFTPSGARYDDSAWQPVDLPHDWAVDLPFENAAELVDFGCKPLGRNYPATSIGWYRRTFDIPAGDNGRRLAVEFDGVFRNATVALNGHLRGTNFSGYAPVRYDVTDLVTYGGRNVLVVRVDATEREGWFYEGAGIYRHVWLEKTPPLHVAPNGVFATSEVAAGTGRVRIANEVMNDGDRAVACCIASAIVDGNGRTVAAATTPVVSVAPHKPHAFTQLINVPSPSLWSPDAPHLYRLVTRVLPHPTGIPVDQYETVFGIRSIRFDAANGFFLNGQRLALKGTCNHQDHAGVGAAVPDAVQRFRIARLKAMGCNAYRTAHNPPAPEVLDACDRLGMLVLDETRLFSSNEEGLSQLDRLIRRDRNHPSVFAWSIANEEWSDQANERGRRIAASLVRRAHELDPSRPVTAGMDSGYENGPGITLAVDVQGFNYQRENLDAFHAKYPSLPAMGTETASAYATRGIYARDEARGYVSAYDVNKPDYGATAEQWWSFYAARPYLAGGFVWTGFDYRGEPSPFKWPCISSHFGIMDTCGFPKDTFYYYQSVWGQAPVLHLFPHWNWPGREGADVDVWCFTNLERVELFVNGSSAGSQTIAKHSHAAWKVPFAPGTIEARGYRADGSSPVLIARRETTGAAAKVLLKPDRAAITADGEDVSIVEVQIADAQNRVVPTASNGVSFSISGPGRMIGLGNGDPSCHEPDRPAALTPATAARSAFNGLCAVLVQATRNPGTITLEAASPGLERAIAQIAASAGAPRPTL